MAYQHIKRYQNFYGVDYKTNDLDFLDQFATEVDNVSFSASGTLEKRKGIQAFAEPGAKFGIFTYNRIDEDGVEQAEVLGCSNTVSKLSTTTLTVTYSGANPVVNFSLFYDPIAGQFCAHIEEGTTVKLNQLLGVGRDEAVPYTVAQLKTAIDSILGGLFSATISGDSSVPAAFLKTTKVTSFASSPISTSAKYWSSINVSPQTGKVGPLQGSETNKNEANFQNVTSAQLQNCIYFSNGYDPVLKYDGQNVYRAGLPPASDGSTGTFSITASGAAGPGSPAVPNVYVWRQQFIQVDNNGNQIEGNTSSSPEYNLKEPALSPLNTVTVTVTNIQAGSGFNTNCALITGSGTSATVPVSAGFTIKAGDTAYLWDTNATPAATYVTREVLSVDNALNTITLDSSVGYTNSVTNNQNVISNNLRIRILRNKNSNLSIPGVSPTLWFEVIEIPNNSFTATSTFGDTTPDASLFTQFLEPATDRSPPQPGKYISAYQNLMVTAGNLENPNEVSFSDVANPEYFPRVAAQFTVTNLQGDIISGIHPSTESFIIFQKRAIHAVTGDVPNQNFRVDILTQDIGCASHATIQDLRGTIVFLSNVGPRVMSGNALPKGLGSAVGNELNSRIDPLFLQFGKPEEELFRTQRSIGFNDRKNERYLLYVPAETVESGERFANENSRVLVYDYTRDAWISWSNLNMHGGITSFNEDREIYFVERRDSDLVIPTTDIKHYLYRFLDTNTFLDYEDHDEPVALTYKSKWEFMGETALLKNFVRIRVYSAELIDSDFVLDIETEKDFTVDAPVSICTLDFGSVGYGDGAWDTGPWGDPSSPAIKHKLSNGRAISLRVIFKNSEDQKNIAITGYELEVALPYAPGFKK